MVASKDDGQRMVEYLASRVEYLSDELAKTRITQAENIVRYNELEKRVFTNMTRLETLEAKALVSGDTANLVQAHQSMINMVRRWGIRGIILIVLTVVFGERVALKAVEFISKQILQLP